MSQRTLFLAQEMLIPQKIAARSILPYNINRVAEQLTKQSELCISHERTIIATIMKPAVCVLLSVLVLFALYSEIDATPADGGNANCRGTNDRRCPQILCGPDGPKGWRQQDNTKPYPKCCGGPICA